MQDLSKRYWRIKYVLIILDSVYLIFLLFLFLNSGISYKFSVFALKLVKNKPTAIAIYFLIIYILYAILNFPLNFYRSFVLEHKFSLSRQSFISWLKDNLKSGLIFYVFSLILIEFLYFSFDYSPYHWWILVSFFWIFLSIILAKILPTFIIPLFFKYKKINDENLKRHILELASKMKVKILDIFEIDLSKKTTKANACFLGLGKTKRIILSDTLKDRYTPEEIEVILAHELAHFRFFHLWKFLFLEAIFIVLNFYIIFKTQDYFFKFYGLNLKDIAGLPVIFIYLILYEIITLPFKNLIKRICERNADIFALKITGLKEAFISLMEKIAQQNLADRFPHPIIKLFFFDHPPIGERINLAKNFRL